MSNAKHSPRTDALDTLGSIITENEKRDAIHLAVEPAVAGYVLRPGDHVGFLSDGTLGLCKDSDCVGIVDPFLKYSVAKGERFWLIVYPRQITSLRHVWTHPAFPEAVETPVQAEAETGPVAESRRWIESFADDMEQTYESLMEAAAKWFEDAEYTNDDNQNYKRHENRFPEFWAHYEVVTGRKIDGEWRESFFTCCA